MGIFDWFKRRSRQRAAGAPLPEAQSSEAPAAASALEPDTLWRIGCDSDEIWMIDPEGARRSVPLAELLGIAIETSDTGTAGLDVWWLFYGADEDLAFAAPRGVAGEVALVARISELPGFRHDRFAAATESSDVDTFVVWQRSFD